MADYNTHLKKLQEDKENMAGLNKQIASINTLAANQTKTVMDSYNAQIADAEADYEDARRENAVQKKVNEFYIAEEMANTGSTNSGFNRTQITANQLYYANNNAKADRYRQSMVDALTREMNTKAVEIENTRLSSEQSARDTWDANNKAMAQSLYEADVDAETALAKERIAAEQKLQTELANKNKAQRTEYLGIVSDIDSFTNGDKSAESVFAKIYSYIQEYDADIDFNPNDYYSGTCANAEILNLLETMGVSASAWKNYYLKRNGFSADFNGDGKVDTRDLVSAKKTGNTALINHIKGVMKG